MNERRLEVVRQVRRLRFVEQCRLARTCLAHEHELAQAHERELAGARSLRASRIEFCNQSPSGHATDHLLQRCVLSRMDAGLAQQLQSVLGVRQQLLRATEQRGQAERAAAEGWSRIGRVDRLAQRMHEARRRSQELQEESRCEEEAEALAGCRTVHRGDFK